MKLNRIKPGDIVTVDDGLPQLAHVLAKEPRRLIVKPIVPGRPTLAPRHVKAAWVTEHWRKVA